MASDRTYDVVVFGATGYTGQFVAQELYHIKEKEGGKALKWAAAGRSKAKVNGVLKDCGIEGIDVLVADVGDQDSLEGMCRQATVIIDCVGPYILYGEPVVKACINQKCSYVDITGETYFMESIEAKYHQQAQDCEVYIVSACGFDSIPNDLGALLVQRSFNGDLAYVDSYMQVNFGARSNMNTGTWESILRLLRSHKKLMELRKSLHLPALKLPTSTKPPSRWPLFYGEVPQRWCVPFPGADKAVVYRSTRHRQEEEGISAFTFRPYFSLDSVWLAVVMVPFLLMIMVLLLTEWGLNLLIKHHKLVTFGFIQTPKKENHVNIDFSTTLVGYGHSPGADKTGPPDTKVTVQVKGKDPAYGATAAMLVQSALCIVYERESLPQSGGVYTPAVAFGNTHIMEGLTKSGNVTFQVIDN